MKLLLLRHAIAEPRREELPDALRALTAEGREKMERALDGLRRLVPRVDLIATSSLVRAYQTADLLAAAYPSCTRIELQELSPEVPVAKLGSRLKSVRQRTVALVGHEPGLGLFASWLLAGQTRSFVALKKGGAVLLELDGVPRPRAATVQWVLTNKHLRGVA